MKVYVAVYEGDWNVVECDTEKMRVLPCHVAERTDFIYDGLWGHMNELFLTREDAWEYIREKTMNKRYYLDYDGEVKKVA